MCVSLQSEDDESSATMERFSGENQTCDSDGFVEDVNGYR